MKEQSEKEDKIVLEKKRPASEISEEENSEHKISNKRRKLESCLTELSDMLSQIRNDAKLVASSTMTSLKHCKETSEAVSEFARHGMKALPEKSTAKPKDKENA